MRSSSERETSPSSSARLTRRSSEPSRGRHRRGALAPLAIALGVGAALRAVGIQYGLPFGNLLNPDEQSIVPRAWKLVHGGGGDPHWFDYPTLLMYVNAPFQAWQSHPSFLSARIVAIVLALAAIAAAWWLGRAAFGATAAAVAAIATAVCTIHVAYSREAVTDVPLTLGVAAALALMVTGRIELAGLAAGLATGFKYPGVFLLAPLVVAAWGKWRRLAIACVLMAAAFFVSSPFVLVHRSQAWHEAFRVQRLARKGWLGFEHDHSAPIAFVDRLWHGLGPALIVAAVGLGFALVRRSRTDLVLATFVVVYFADLLTLRAHFDRYTLPLVPPLAVFAGRFRPLAPVTLLLLIVPLTWTIRDDKALTRTDTRIVAARWIAAHVPPHTHIAADPSTALRGTFDVLPLQLPAPWQPPDPNRDVRRLRREGIKVVVTTGAIADRVRKAADRYPKEVRFYDDLQARGRLLYRVTAGGGRSGPWVDVFGL
jgi:4-amino-4-deoxy-L-arabinose transferase-like glycosyltransferase